MNMTRKASVPQSVVMSLPLDAHLKQTYDSCFNSWFGGYLEPEIAASSTQEQRSKQRANGFQEFFGKISLQVRLRNVVYILIIRYQEAVKDKGLDKLLQQAREENLLIDPIQPSVPYAK